MGLPITNDRAFYFDHYSPFLRLRQITEQRDLLSRVSIRLRTSLTLQIDRLGRYRYSLPGHRSHPQISGTVANAQYRTLLRFPDSVVLTLPILEQLPIQWSRPLNADPSTTLKAKVRTLNQVPADQL